jgi:CHAT domain-containing protein
VARQPSFAKFWKSAAVDLDELRRGLQPLPETADELRSIAKSVGARPADIKLGAKATEAAVKQARLDDYRIVYFATHGLVAGDLEKLSEPALALSVPQVASELDDGLLTASEIAFLRLDADWVVLSACNTASPESPHAEGLSGLAKAFFHAGARSLLVSHWAVSSDAAAVLAISTFKAMQRNSTMGRAEALRQAMLSFIRNKADPWKAYPSYWAPFVVVGEGRR